MRSLLILCACVRAATGLDPDSDLARTLATIDHAVLAIFTAELLLKVTGLNPKPNPKLQP